MQFNNKNKHTQLNLEHSTLAHGTYQNLFVFLFFSVLEDIIVYYAQVLKRLLTGITCRQDF
jgi:hypothetical protein